MEAMDPKEMGTSPGISYWEMGSSQKVNLSLWKRFHRILQDENKTPDNAGSMVNRITTWLGLLRCENPWPSI